jgi:hypothetical protein
LTVIDTGDANEISETPDSAGHDAKSQPIPLSDIGNQGDDADAMVVDKPTQVGSFYVFFIFIVNSTSFGVGRWFLGAEDK